MRGEEEQKAFIGHLNSSYATIECAIDPLRHKISFLICTSLFKGPFPVLSQIANRMRSIVLNPVADGLRTFAVRCQTMSACEQDNYCDGCEG